MADNNNGITIEKIDIILESLKALDWSKPWAVDGNYCHEIGMRLNPLQLHKVVSDNQDGRSWRKMLLEAKGRGAEAKKKSLQAKESKVNQSPSSPQATRRVCGKCQGANRAKDTH